LAHRSQNLTFATNCNLTSIGVPKNKQIFLLNSSYTADRKPRPQETAGLVHEARALTENILK
jgi:hypothetical protein